MKEFGFRGTLKFVPELDPDFRPLSMDNRAFLTAVEASGEAQEVAIAIERKESAISRFDTKIFGKSEKYQNDNIVYIERLVKTLLWLKGGYKVYFGGPAYIGEYLKEAYSAKGQRSFDADYMRRIYEKELEIVTCSLEEVPKASEESKPAGRNLSGCRIGFDAGGSDRKVSAVVDGVPVYSEEVVWHPKLEKDPAYHYQGILDSMKRAASKMERVDAIGVSSAGIYIDNQVKVASLFINVDDEQFEKKVKNIYFDAAKEMGDIPFEVANDGDVTALAGAMSLDKSCILGIAMGTSEAAGYVNKDGNITGWLNELAFVPVDYNPSAMEDEWSGDIGCGVKYFSQDGVNKLAPRAGIELDEALSPAEKLKVVQHLMENDDERAIKVYDSIGYCLGYALAYYAAFYDIEHVLLLGRVTSGKGGDVIVNNAREVLKQEFTGLNITISLPDEKSRRVGQSVAAASLPRT